MSMSFTVNNCQIGNYRLLNYFVITEFQIYVQIKTYCYQKSLEIYKSHLPNQSNFVNSKIEHFTPLVMRSLKSTYASTHKIN